MLETLLFLLPAGFYLALLLRWLRLGLRSPRALSIELDPAYQQAFRQEILQPIVERYFGASLDQWEALPAQDAVIVAMNHAGMCFPWDFVSLGLLLSQQQTRFVQPFAHPIFFEHPWLRWWLPPGWATVLGGVRADQAHLEQAVTQPSVLLYAPEGWRGLSKGWQQRYRLSQFDPSFVRLSIRQRVPILPVICLGSESLHPFALNLKGWARSLKLPIFPLSPLMPIFLLFPSMGVWAARSRLRYFIQPLWYPWETIAPATELPSNRETYRLAEQLRAQLQVQIDHLRRQS